MAVGDELLAGVTLAGEPAVTLDATTIGFSGADEIGAGAAGAALAVLTSPVEVAASSAPDGSTDLKEKRGPASF